MDPRIWFVPGLKSTIPVHVKTTDGRILEKWRMRRIERSQPYTSQPCPVSILTSRSNIGWTRALRPVEMRKIRLRHPLHTTSASGKFAMPQAASSCMAGFVGHCCEVVRVDQMTMHAVMFYRGFPTEEWTGPQIAAVED
jgi:hypothetical protein